jgi:hypothetical protein
MRTPSQTTKIEFDEETISDGIFIKDNKAVCVSSNKNGHKFAMIKFPLESEKEWKVRITEYSYGWLAVGACIKDIVLSNQFKFSDNEQSHFYNGCFLISSNSYSWNTNSHTQDSTLQEKLPKFKKGMEILIKYSPKDDTLTFTISKNVLTLTNVWCNEKSTLLPCVVFLNSNDAVEFYF